MASSSFPFSLKYCWQLMIFSAFGFVHLKELGIIILPVFTTKCGKAALFAASSFFFSLFIATCTNLFKTLILSTESKDTTTGVPMTSLFFTFDPTSCCGISENVISTFGESLTSATPIATSPLPQSITVFELNTFVSVWINCLIIFFSFTLL